MRRTLTSAPSRARRPCRARRPRPGPSERASAASASASAGSYHGGTCVTTSRPTPARCGQLAGLPAGQVQVRRVRRAVGERRLGQQQVGARGERVDRRAGRRCRRCRPGCAARRQPQGVALDRVQRRAPPSPRTARSRRCPGSTSSKDSTRPSSAVADAVRGGDPLAAVPGGPYTGRGSADARPGPAVGAYRSAT